jgi:DNA excision repair protein ERCC-1
MSGSSSSAPPAAAAATKAKVVINPYAKKKSTVTATTSTSTNNNTTHSNGTASDNNPYDKNRRRQEQVQEQSQRRPPPPPVNEYTTFSQAFGDVDPDANIFLEEERDQQRAFDDALASTSSSIGDSSGATKSTNNYSVTENPRDHHTMLQPHVLHISTRQRGNPILVHIRNVPYQFSTMVPDYIVGATRCVLFLSLRYHNLHPGYIHRRIAELKSDFEYRMLLCYVDIEDNTSPLLLLNDLCVQNNFTLMLAWSEEEAARYLETAKALEGKKDASILKGNKYTEHIDQVAHALGSVRSVNKTDASQLLTQFGCWKNLAGASLEELSVCPGVGPKKVRRLWEAFHRPFSTEMAKRRKTKENEKQDVAKEGEEKNALVDSGEAIHDEKEGMPADDKK